MSTLILADKPAELRDCAESPVNLGAVGRFLNRTHTYPAMSHREPHTIRFSSNDGGRTWHVVKAGYPSHPACFLHLHHAEILCDFNAQLALLGVPESHVAGAANYKAWMEAQS